MNNELPLGDNTFLELKLRFVSEDVAQYIAKSISVDDDGFIFTQVNGCELIATAKARTIGSLRHTLDDYLGALSVAESLMKKDTE